MNQKFSNEYLRFQLTNFFQNHRQSFWKNQKYTPNYKKSSTSRQPREKSQKKYINSNCQLLKLYQNDNLNVIEITAHGHRLNITQEKKVTGYYDSVVTNPQVLKVVIFKSKQFNIY